MRTWQDLKCRKNPERPPVFFYDAVSMFDNSNRLYLHHPVIFCQKLVSQCRSEVLPACFSRSAFSLNSKTFTFTKVEVDVRKRIKISLIRIMIYLIYILDYNFSHFHSPRLSLWLNAENCFIQSVCGLDKSLSIVPCSIIFPAPRT